jgi:hypothetical protein
VASSVLYINQTWRLTHKTTFSLFCMSGCSQKGVPPCLQAVRFLCSLLAAGATFVVCALLCGRLGRVPGYQWAALVRVFLILCRRLDPNDTSACLTVDGGRTVNCRVYTACMFDACGARLCLPVFCPGSGVFSKLALLSPGFSNGTRPEGNSCRSGVGVCAVSTFLAAWVAWVAILTPRYGQYLNDQPVYVCVHAFQLYVCVQAFQLRGCMNEAWRLPSLC